MIGTLLGLLGSIPWEAIMAAGAAALSFFLYRKGRTDERAKQERSNLQNYIDTRRKADEAADLAREVGALGDDELNGRLRKRGAFRE